MYFLLNMRIFHCYVSLPKSIYIYSRNSVFIFYIVYKFEYIYIYILLCCLYMEHPSLGSDFFGPVRVSKYFCRPNMTPGI